MSMPITHSYHLVDQSYWPYTSSLGAMYSTFGFVDWFAHLDPSLLIIGNLLILLSMYQWWRDVSYESSSLGLHSSIVELGLRWGVVLFIISEIFFFLSFFWAFFHSSLASVVELGSQWPPKGIVPFNPWEVPLLNTVILLSSGISVTWAHHALMDNYLKSSIFSLSLTVILGAYFSLLQYEEYAEASYAFADGVFGSTFFIATGFHGIHVIIGSTYLLISLLRMTSGKLNWNHHFGFEAAAWYWHFVDVVWLFLFATMYWWGAQ